MQRKHQYESGRGKSESGKGAGIERTHVLKSGRNGVGQSEVEDPVRGS